jgi:hypothetical protein
MIQKIKRAIVLGKTYSISDLNNTQNALSNINNRGKVPILIIDDEGFDDIEKLRDEGYNLKCITSIEDLRTASEYPIVICDIKGVGTQYSSEKGGLIVVKELKKMYPFKKYAVYSGNDYKLDDLNSLEGVSRIPKTTDVETWKSYFDELIDSAASPIDNWKTMRTFLLNHDVSLLEVLKLENSFVYTYLYDSPNMKNFPSEKEFPSLSSDIRAIINNMIAAGVMKLLMSAAV